MPAFVLYTFDPEFKTGYEKVINMYPQIDFIAQTDFKSQLAEAVKSSDLILFLPDDNVLITAFSIDSPEVREFREDTQVATLSLGLSADIAGKKWKWADYRGNYRLRMWGYPMSVDSCLFRTEDILPIIQTHDILNLNYLETHLNQNIPDRPLMMCFDTPKLINNSVNQVQKDFPAHTSGPSPEELEEKFLSGKRISLTDIKEKAKKSRFYRIKEDYVYEDY